MLVSILFSLKFLNSPSDICELFCGCMFGLLVSHISVGTDAVLCGTKCKNWFIFVKDAFKEVFAEVGYVPPKKIYGVTLEDRGTQMTFSPLGQDVVTHLGNKGVIAKEEWKKQNNPLRLKMARLLKKRLKELEVHTGGQTLRLRLESSP